MIIIKTAVCWVKQVGQIKSGNELLFTFLFLPTHYGSEKTFFLFTQKRNKNSTWYRCLLWDFFSLSTSSHPMMI
ncbi:CLUMA_CG008799, isoform A [Clunio marinus]|uniref:CLUMA_CG008799, isoform A n=1 Tax=Clunio marinus TaxID=568069 RepID=A0A1J1I8E8_9DIPT|nr:CLUMA_CG008799, isoform A [Clunio marinus]